MKKRLFLKLAALIAVLPRSVFGAAKKQYVTQIKWPELIGVRFEWPKCEWSENPAPGHDWVIVSQADSPLHFQGRWIDNPLRDKYWGVPIGKLCEPKLFCFEHVVSDRSQADLSVAKFYLACIHF